MSSVPYILNENSLTVMMGTAPKTVSREHPYFNDIVEAVKDKDWEEVFRLIDMETAINEFAGSNSGVEVKNGTVYYKGQEVHNTLTERIMFLHRNGHDIDPFVNFMENLMENPSYRATHELFDFLEACTLPITDDGRFLAYKKVRDNYMDVHSGTFDNSPGSVPQMERNFVDEDKNRTCSAGLHICSYSYLSHYPGDRVVMVKVNPADVVAIPADHGNAKARVSQYEVIKDITDDYISDYYVPMSEIIVEDDDVDDLDFLDEEEDDRDDVNRHLNAIFDEIVNDIEEFIEGDGYCVVEFTTADGEHRKKAVTDIVERQKDRLIVKVAPTQQMNTILLANIWDIE